MASAAVWRGLVAVEMNHLRSRRLLQGKLLIAESKVHADFDHRQRNFVFLFRPPYFDARRKDHGVVVLIVAIVGVGDEGTGFVINELTVGQKVEAAEDDLARNPAVAAAGTNDVYDVIGLLVFV